MYLRGGGLDMHVKRSVLFATALIVLPAIASAQHIPLAELLPRLVLSEITLVSLPIFGVPGFPDGFTHLAHFTPIDSHELTNPAVAVVQAFNTQMATQFATFPLG